MQELYKAVRSGDAVRVEELIAADPSLAIFAAVISGDEAKAEALLTGNRGVIGCDVVAAVQKPATGEDECHGQQNDAEDPQGPAAGSVGGRNSRFVGHG